MKRGVYKLSFSRALSSQWLVLKLVWQFLWAEIPIATNPLLPVGLCLISTAINTTTPITLHRRVAATVYGHLLREYVGGHAHERAWEFHGGRPKVPNKTFLTKLKKVKQSDLISPLLSPLAFSHLLFSSNLPALLSLYSLSLSFYIAVRIRLLSLSRNTLRFLSTNSFCNGELSESPRKP